MPKGLVRQCRHLQALCSSFTPSILYHPLENCLSPPQSLQFPHFQCPWVLPAATPGSIQSHFLDMTCRAAKLCAEIMREVNKTSLGVVVLKCQCRKEEIAVQSVSTRDTNTLGEPVCMFIHDQPSPLEWKGYQGEACLGCILALNGCWEELILIASNVQSGEASSAVPVA